MILLKNLISKNKDRIFSLGPFVKINKRLSNFEKFKFTFIPPSAIDVVDNEKITLDLVKNEFNKIIYGEITNSLFNSKNHDLLDLRNVDQEDRPGKIIKILYDNFHNYKFKNFVTCGSLVGDIMETSAFSSTFDMNNSSNIYMFGTLMGKDGYIDPYMRYDDTRICLFDKVELNIKNVELYEIPTDSFNPQVEVEVEVEFSYKINNTKVIYVLKSESDVVYSEYKQKYREEKISKILDESNDE